MQDREEFFIKVIAYVFDNHEDWQKLKRIGVTAKSFPKSLQPIMKDFEAIADKNSTLAAKMKILSRYEKLPKPAKKISPGEIAAKFHQNAKFVKGVELAGDLMKDPENADRIISEWKKNISSSVELSDFHSNLEATILNHEQRLKNGKTIIKIPSWELLSEMIGGFNPGRLIILTAKTGVGKTNLALNLGIKAASSFPVLYFNMEMVTDDIFSRMIKSIGKITSHEWNNGSYAQNGKLESLAKIYNGDMNNKFLVSSGKAQTIEEITSTIVQKKDEHGLGLVIIDYDQKIKTEDSFGGEQWQQLHRAGEELEEVAKYCELPIILLAQANEEGNVRASQRIQQGAATHLNFYQDEETNEFILEAKKNRFGRQGAKVKIIYKPEMSYCEERVYEPSVLPKPTDTNGKRNRLSKSVF